MGNVSAKKADIPTLKSKGILYYQVKGRINKIAGSRGNRLLVFLQQILRMPVSLTCPDPSLWQAVPYQRSPIHHFNKTLSITINCSCFSLPYLRLCCCLFFFFFPPRDHFNDFSIAFVVVFLRVPLCHIGLFVLSNQETNLQYMCSCAMSKGRRSSEYFSWSSGLRSRAQNCSHLHWVHMAASRRQM